MKIVQNVNIIIALLAAVAVLNSAQLAAQENGFTLEESIHQQVFHELRHNVEQLYQNTRLVQTGSDDEDVIARTAQSGFILPAAENRSAAARTRLLNTVN